eukprot:1158819-Pelagomonas_calceolata.AAC.3
MARSRRKCARVLQLRQISQPHEGSQQLQLSMPSVCWLRSSLEDLCTFDDDDDDDNEINLKRDCAKVADFTISAHKPGFATVYGLVSGKGKRTSTEAVRRLLTSIKEKETHWLKES